MRPWCPRPGDPPAASSSSHYNQSVVTTSRGPLVDVLLRRPEPRVGLVIGVVVATIIHLAVLPGARLLPQRVPPRDHDGVGVWAGLGAAADHRRIELSIAPAPTPPPAPLVEQPADEPRGQVVKLPAKKVERPAAADFLAEQDQRADRETRARVTGVTETTTRRPQLGRERDVDAASDVLDPGPRAASAGNAMTAGGPQGDGASTSGDALAWDSRDPGGGAPAMALQVPRQAPKNAVDVPVTTTGQLRAGESQPAVTGNGDVLRIAMGRLTPSTATTSGAGTGAGGVGRKGGTGDDGLPGRPLALPSLGELEKLAGLPVADALDVEEDVETNLNTFEYRHATFFHRVADAIRREWVGGEVLARTDPGGHVYGLDDRVTVVHVTIDTEGNVVDLALQETSGAAPLDDEALRSFRVAGPFPHPPGALFRGRDRFSFTFGFNVVYERSRLDLDWRPH
jgi:TonB family protein